MNGEGRPVRGPPGRVFTNTPMKPSFIPPVVLASALVAPWLHAQESSEKVRDIERKVLRDTYQNAVRELVRTAGGSGDSTPEALGKQLRWIATVDARIESDGTAPAAPPEDMTESAAMLNDLAWGMLTAPAAADRRPKIALELATLALKLAGEDADLKPKALDTRARALFLLGRRGEAVAEQEKAVAAATDAEEKAGFEATLSDYRTDASAPPAHPTHETAGDAATGVAHTLNKIRSIVIPQIDFEDTSLEEAVDFLRTRSRELDAAEPDPARKGVNLVIRIPAAKPASGDGAAGPGAIRIKDLHLRNIPLAYAIKYLCDAARMRYKVDDAAVTLFLPDDAEKDLFTRHFMVPSGFASPLVSTQELLRLCGVRFGEGASAKLLTSGELVVVNTPSELDKIAQLIPMGRIEETQNPQAGLPDEPDPTAGNFYLTEKLKTIVIPAVEFEDTSVEEAVDFLRQQAKGLDKAELDPARKGVNFVIRRPRSDGAGEAGKNVVDPGAFRVKELRLRNVPLGTALKHLCDQTKLRYKVDDFAVTLFPPAEVDQDLFTRAFRVPANFGSPLVPIQELLKANGVLFGEGSSAVLSSPGVLLVTNTAAELDKIERLIEATRDGGRKASSAPPEPAPNGP